MLTGNKTLLTSISVAALMAGGPAFAEDARTANQNGVPRYSEEEIEQGLEDAKEAASDAAETISENAKETYADIKEMINGKNKADISSVKIDRRTTAAGMIGQPVFNENGARVAKVKDIILNKDGEATMVILADGGWTGLGKLAAFDYSVIANTDQDGDMISPLTEEMINKAAAFSYDRDSHDDSTKVIPRNGYSVAALLDANLLDQQGQTIAEIDDITFHDGEADRIVVGFDQTLGLGGKRAAMGFEDPDIVQKDGQAQFKLSEAQSKQFKAYKKTALN